jgi:hypothetical protein
MFPLIKVKFLAWAAAFMLPVNQCATRDDGMPEMPAVYNLMLRDDPTYRPAAKIHGTQPHLYRSHT